MMGQLNEFTAHTPFQIDAVAKSARQLIASGTEIADVNDQLQFLGDIAATSGASIDEIAAIFAKVNAKGKVELKNLNQLAERGIPIFDALAKATGLPADELGAGAVSVQQFNDVLKSFAEQGGFAAGAMERMSKTALGKFSTALDNIKIALGSIGEAFLPMVNSILDAIVSMSQAFARLSPFVKRVMIIVGTFVATLGPLLFIVPKLIAVVGGLRGAMMLLNLAMLANPAVAIAAGIAALAAVVIGFNVDVGNAVETTRDWRMELLALNNEGKKIELEQRIQSANDALDEHIEILERFRQLRDAAQLPSEQMKWQRAMDSHQKVIDGINEELSDYGDELIKVEAALADAAESQRQLNLAALDGVDTLGKLFSKLENVKVGADKAVMSMGEFFSMLENVQVKANQTKEEFLDMGAVFGQALTEIAGSFDGTGNFIMKGLRTLGNMMVNIGNQMIALAVTMKKFRKFIITNPGLAIAAGVGFVIAGQALSNMAQRNLEVPALAQGGVAYGPTMAMIGDNRNAAIDPEVVAPLSKLKDMMGGNQVEVFGRIQGNDIYLSNARTGTSRNRYA